MKKISGILFYVLFGLLGLSYLLMFIFDFVDLFSVDYLNQYGILGIMSVSLSLELFLSISIVAISIYAIFKKIHRSSEDKSLINLTSIIFSIQCLDSFLMFGIITGIYDLAETSVPTHIIIGLVFSILSLIIFTFSIFLNIETKQIEKQIILIGSLFCIFISEIMLIIQSTGISVLINIFLLLCDLIFGTLIIICCLKLKTTNEDTCTNTNPENTLVSKTQNTSINNPNFAYEELEKLHVLLDKGIISQEVYDEKSKKYIDEL